MNDRVPEWMVGRSKIRILIRSGQDNPQSSFTDAQVVEIKAIYRTGRINQYELADAYRVSQNVISKTIRRVRVSKTRHF